MVQVNLNWDATAQGPLMCIRLKNQLVTVSSAFKHLCSVLKRRGEEITQIYVFRWLKVSWPSGCTERFGNTSAVNGHYLQGWLSIPAEIEFAANMVISCTNCNAKMISFVPQFGSLLHTSFNGNGLSRSCYWAYAISVLRLPLLLEYCN